MTHRHHRCGPERRAKFSIPEAVLAMAGRRGWGGPFGHIHIDFGDDGEDGGRGRRNRLFKRELQLVLLKLIADEPRHGYDLIRAIEELTHGDYVPSPGVVYPTLTLLQDMELIEEAPSEGTRKPFRVTAEGRKHLDECDEDVVQLFERLEAYGASRRRSQRPEMGRAIGNLMTALKNRIAHEGWNEQLLNDVVDILDEAAQRIERVKGARDPKASGGE